MVAARSPNPGVSASHLDSVRPVLTSTASGACRLRVAIFAAGCQNPYRWSIWSNSGSASLHGHPWCERDSDRRIACGVLGTPSITQLLRGLREQDVEDELRCPRYLIGATGEAAARLRQDPEDPLPLRQLIFQNRDDNIRVCFLDNSGQAPLAVLVMESGAEDTEDLDETHEPPNGMYKVFARASWEESASAEYGARAIEEEVESFDEHEWLQAEAEVAPQAPPGAGVIVVDNGGVSIQTEQGLRSKLDT